MSNQNTSLQQAQDTIGELIQRVENWQHQAQQIEHLRGKLSGMALRSLEENDLPQAREILQSLTTKSGRNG